MRAVKRPFIILVLVNADEREELQKAAERSSMSLSTCIRARALAAIRREARVEQQIERILETEES